MAIRKTRRQLVMDAGSIAAIYAAGWGNPAVAESAPVPQPAPTVSALMRSLVDTLNEEIAEYEDGIDALTQRPMLASVWADLCDLAGEPVPADVEAAFGGPAIEPRDLSVLYPLDERGYGRHARYQAALGSLMGAARRYRDGDMDDAGMKDAAHDALAEAWQLGEDKTLAAKIVAYQAMQA